MEVLYLFYQLSTFAKKNFYWYLKKRRPMPNIAIYGNMTISLRRTLNIPTPSYVQVIQYWVGYS